MLIGRLIVEVINSVMLVPVCLGRAKKDKGKRENCFVASGDLLERMTNVGWQDFAAQLHTYHMLG